MGKDWCKKLQLHKNDKIATYIKVKELQLCEVLQQNDSILKKFCFLMIKLTISLNLRFLQEKLDILGGEVFILWFLLGEI